MKLESIHLRNFGSYADAEIDLRPITTGVVVGQNGAGKSTVFVDGPLWALFGKCRVSADDILRIGTDEMAVTVTFTINGQTYRVIRKRSVKTKAGKSELALQLSVGDGWEDVSGSRLPDTQDKIIALLNADYELLVSTAFLLQGQADKFSRATPSERKAILAQILRLDQYSLLKQAASRHATIVETKLGDKQQLVRTAEAKAAALPSLHERQVEIAAAMDESHRALTSLEQHQQELTIKQAQVEAELAQLDVIPEQVKGLQAKRATLQASTTALTERKTRASKILANLDKIEAMLQSEADVTAKLHQAEQALQKNAGLLKEFQDKLDHASKEMGNGAAIKAEVDQLTRDLEVLRSNYAQATTTLEHEIAREEQQAHLLAVVPCDATLQGQCQFTLTAVQVQAGLPAKRDALATRKAATNLFPDEARAITEATGRLDVWAAGQWAEVKSGLESGRNTLRDEATRLQDTITTLRDALAEARKFTALKPELDAADREVSQVDQDLGRISGEQRTIEQELQALQVKGDARATLQAEQRNVVASLGQDKIYMTKIKGDADLAIGRLKEIEIEIKAAEEASRQAQDLQKECDALGLERGRFLMLATAYAQIPVLIMETAIPLLEDEANRILGKISTAGMRVRFDTQKALKSRDGLAETLDIAVRDVFGERPLEAYSGGERARADLSIRIGLSKLLANRAGARLETLIVDEAFAAVDREGVEQLVECLPMLSEEFGLLLFITHDENFKSSVAQQLIVTKGSHGSQVEVLA